MGLSAVAPLASSQRLGSAHHGSRVRMLRHAASCASINDMTSTRSLDLKDDAPIVRWRGTRRDEARLNFIKDCTTPNNRVRSRVYVSENTFGPLNGGSPKEGPVRENRRINGAGCLVAEQRRDQNKLSTSMKLSSLRGPSSVARFPLVT